MSDHNQEGISKSRVYWLLGGVVALCVSVDFAMTSAYDNIMRDRLEDRQNSIKQLEIRFTSDIDQHDKRIANNADTVRTIMRMLPQNQQKELAKINGDEK